MDPQDRPGKDCGDMNVMANGITNNDGTPKCVESQLADHNIPDWSTNKMTFDVKWIRWSDGAAGGSMIPVVTQYGNGPCSLLALVNLLFLRGQARLDPDVQNVSSELLLTILHDHMVQMTPKGMSAQRAADYQRNIEDALISLPKLLTGIDVNVRFTGVDQFEFTPDYLIFDLLNIRLLHGWLVEPEHGLADVVGQFSFDQLAVMALENANESLTAFLNSSQLTNRGLCELNSTLKDGALCVFFRNNHFSTLLKHDNELFCLVTDQGFLNDSRVWERLDCVNGDSRFVDVEFRTVPPKPISVPVVEGAAPLPANASPQEQLDHGLMVALSLEEQERAAALEAAGILLELVTGGASREESDRMLALKLQEEINGGQRATRTRNAQRRRFIVESTAKAFRPKRKRTTLKKQSIIEYGDSDSDGSSDDDTYLADLAKKKSGAARNRGRPPISGKAGKKQGASKRRKKTASSSEEESADESDDEGKLEEGELDDEPDVSAKKFARPGRRGNTRKSMEQSDEDSDVSMKFTDGFDEAFVGDDDDRQRLAQMTMKDREEEIFRRLERREMLQTRFEIEKKLRKARKKGERSEQNFGSDDLRSSPGGGVSPRESKAVSKKRQRRSSQKPMDIGSGSRRTTAEKARDTKSRAMQDLISKRHQCGQCGKVLSNRPNYNKHLKVHLQPLDCICEMCGYVANRDCDVTRHVAKAHTGITKPCPGCGIEFTKRALDKHRKVCSAAM